MHFHRDLLIIADGYAREVLGVTPDDVFVGSPPLAFTFGLGGLAIFPLRFGATATLLENASPANMIEIIETYKATISFTSPTAYRAMMAAMDAGADLSSLRMAVSAGETLPAPVFEDWTRKTGKPILDGIGSTELLHIFITNRLGDAKAGATGKPVAGYEAKIVDDDMKDVPDGTIGHLAVRGPTGCRYLADDRQTKYVRDGWNLTGDDFVRDKDGTFHFAARADDMIISSGYNIAGPEVEAALLSHAAVAECAVVGAPDVERGQIVQAHVVLREGVAADEACIKAAAGPRQGHHRALQVPPLGDVRRRAPQDADRQDPAVQAEAARRDGCEHYSAASCSTPALPRARRAELGAKSAPLGQTIVPNRSARSLANSATSFSGTNTGPHSSLLEVDFTGKAVREPEPVRDTASDDEHRLHAEHVLRQWRRSCSAAPSCTTPRPLSTRQVSRTHCCTSTSPTRHAPFDAPCQFRIEFAHARHSAGSAEAG